MVHLVATKQKVATAATNGAIILWDLNKIGRKAGKISMLGGEKSVNIQPYFGSHRTSDYRTC